jgi:aspartyl-tRNA(Asn)/glutamyl-tRNA(Gln) amidotransferase subunit A
VSTSADASDLCRVTGWDLARMIRSRQVSPVEVVDAVLARIERINPRVNAFIARYPERARAAARRAEAAVSAGQELGPLHGVPVSIKDTYAVRDVPMTFGSKLMANFVATEDAPVITRLRRAGTIDIGRTNTPEFAWRGSTDNLLFGATANPWDTRMTAGGSSGGAAAAVAAGLGPLAIGGDGAGSIRIPASFCGLVGFKPTYGRVALYPKPSTNELTLHAGPITRTVRDAALMLTAMAGPDRRDPLSLPSEGADFVDRLDAGIKGVRVAWSADLGFLPVERETLEIAEAAARAFGDLGALVDDASLKIADPGWILDRLFGGTAAGVHGVRPPDEKAQMDPALIAYAAKNEISFPDYVKGVVARQAIVTQLARFFEQCDLLLTPAVGLPAFPLGIVGPEEVAGRRVTHLGWSSAYVFNWSGQPAISVPAGWTKGGLPVGLQIIGRRLVDDLVLRAAAAFEAARPWSHRWPDIDGR